MYSSFYINLSLHITHYKKKKKQVKDFLNKKTHQTKGLMRNHKNSFLTFRAGLCLYSQILPTWLCCFANPAIPLR